jgi:RNA polymerase sigma-70 factor (ECF subfamily)
MLAFADGDEDAFVTLYQSYRDRMVSYCRRMIGDQAQAEEAAQDVFLKLYRARSSYKPQSRLSTFLYRIATNHCLNMLARVDRKLVRRQSEAQDSEMRSEGDQQRALETDELREALRAALSALPERQRAALLLVHYEGMSYREAADAIEVSEGAVKSLVHRARGGVAAQLERFLPGSEVRRAV